MNPAQTRLLDAIILPARTRLLCAIVVLLCAGLMTVWLADRPLWTPDSYHYAIRMLTYLGESREQAAAQSSIFFEQLPVAHQYKHYADEFRKPISSEYWTLFSPRMLYPAFSAVLWPRFGFFALVCVSLIAYVVATVLVYLLLHEFTAPIIAMIGALLFALSPEITSLGRQADTDMLALTFWILALYCAIAFLRSNERGWCVGFGVAALALSFTRPLVYAPFLATLIPLVSGILRKDRKYALAALACVLVSIAVAVLLFVVAIIDHVPSSTWLIKDMQHYAMPLGPAMSTSLWYQNEIALDIRTWLREWVWDITPVIAVGAMIVYRRYFAVPVLAGALLAGFATILADPLPTDLSRVVIAPMLPAILCGVALAVSPPHRKI